MRTTNPGLGTSFCHRDKIFPQLVAPPGEREKLGMSQDNTPQESEGHNSLLRKWRDPRTDNTPQEMEGSKIFTPQEVEGSKSCLIQKGYRTLLGHSLLRKWRDPKTDNTPQEMEGSKMFTPQEVEGSKKLPDPEGAQDFTRATDRPVS
jgi:hypothetical protein